MVLKLTNIADTLDVAAHNAGDTVITDITTDSRSVVNPASTLFVALTTPNNDGHNYIPELARRGVKNFLVFRIPSGMSSLPGINFLVVDNQLEALQSIGSLCRERLRGTVIGITGSRGKTVVKEILNNVLTAAGKHVSRSPRSYNSQIGVPISLSMADENADYTLIECGISERGEMSRLARIVRPDIGILTSVTDEHADGFDSIEEKIREKIQLFGSARLIIYDRADSLAERLLHDTYPDKCLIGVDCSQYNGPEANLPLACALLNAEGIDAHASYHLINTRLEVIEGVNNTKLIYDGFTADIPSLRIALDFMRRQVPAQMKRTLVIAPRGFADSNDEIATAINDYGINRLVTVGEHLGCTIQGIEHNHFDSVADISTDDFYDEAILIRGGVDTETLQDLHSLLEAKQHETLMEVNLDAIVHNFNFFRSKVKPTTGVICMLKAHGYGAGSVELARTLQGQGAAYLAVAVVDEGVELRRAGISMPIIVLNPRAQNYKVMFDYRLEPEIYSFEMLDEIADSARRCGLHGYPVHIKLETGMRRLGFVEEEIPQLIDRLRDTHRLSVATVFSHLACADDPAEDDYTLSQFAIFERCCHLLDAALPTPPKRHILNSTGIIRFPQKQYDYVRLGIGLYGIPTLTDGSENGLRNVSTLSSLIISIKHWRKGDTVGYNRRGLLKRDSIIATIPVGYADGIDRHLGYGNAAFMVNGKSCPTVGSICMDICMIDVTDVPCRVGDRVEIFGDNISPISLAETIGTIPYEILTSISPRVKRIYYKE